MLLPRYSFAVYDAHYFIYKVLGSLHFFVFLFFTLTLFSVKEYIKSAFFYFLSPQFQLCHFHHKQTIIKQRQHCKIATTNTK